MRILFSAFLTFSALFASADPQIGKPAPEFSLEGHDGKTYSLTDLKKKYKYIVLEWFNKDCPFVKKHYGVENMQKLQAQITADNTVGWFSVISSANGKQGHLTAPEAAAQMSELKMKSTAILIDSKGVMGKTYAAKTTPHMFIIDTEGKIIYMGAIDSDSSSDPATIPAATNYVKAAFDDIRLKQPIKISSTKPYGCGVKY